MDKLIGHVCRLFSMVMVGCLFLMVVMVFGNVVLRYGFNSGITMSEELSRWLFVWMTFLGAIVALRNRAHLGTDSLIARLPVTGKKICLGVSYLLMLYVCWLMFRGGWEQTVINVGTTSAVMEASMAYFYASGVLFAALASVMILYNFWKLLSSQLSESELIGVTESEDAPHGEAPGGTPASAAGK